MVTFGLGMWPWQNAGANPEGTSVAPPNSTGSQQPNNGAHSHGPGELQDMLQMLDHHSTATPYEEDLNMFNTNYIE